MQIIHWVDRGDDPTRGESHPSQPRDGQIANWYWRIGVVHLVQSRLDEAIRWFEKARSASLGLRYVHAHLAAAFALKGEMGGAAASLAEARGLSGDNRYSSVTALNLDRAGARPVL
jgi:hypothetical protein